MHMQNLFIKSLKLLAGNEVFLGRQIEGSNMDSHKDRESVQDFKSVEVEQYCISECAASLSLATRQRRNFI